MSKGILSINGNRPMNYLLQTIFEKDFDFVPVENVYQGMNQLRMNRNIRALVVDMDFEPEQNWELIEHIKSSKLFHIPVIILTTVNNEKLRQRCYQLNVDEIFFKPFNPVDLVSAVKGIMELDIATN